MFPPFRAVSMSGDSKHDGAVVASLSCRLRENREKKRCRLAGLEIVFLGIRSPSFLESKCTLFCIASKGNAEV